MREEDKIWFNGVYPYFRMQKEINNLLILLKKFNTDMEEQEDNFLKLTTELLRILPLRNSNFGLRMTLHLISARC